MQLSKIFTVLALAVSGIQGAPSEGLYVKGLNTETIVAFCSLANKHHLSLQSAPLRESRSLPVSFISNLLFLLSAAY